MITEVKETITLDKDISDTLNKIKLESGVSKSYNVNLALKKFLKNR
jgi:hypothetical protein